MPIFHDLTPLARALMIRHLFTTRSLPTIGLAFALPCMQVQAQELEFNIPAQSLLGALQEFGRQANLQVLYSPSDLQGIRSSGVKGRLSPSQAASKLLQGTNISYSIQENTLTIITDSSSLVLGETSIIGTSMSNTSEESKSYTIGATSTATKLNMSIRETPQSISVITRQRMEDQNLNTIKDTLQQAPGILIAESGPDRYYIFSRGYTISNYQLDGVNTYTDASTQNVPQSLTDMIIYDRVEVLRGASGLLSGAGDPSGAINLIRKKPTSQPQAHVSLGGGTWDNYRSELDISGPLTQNQKIRGRLVTAYQESNSYTDYSETEKQVFYGVIDADLSSELKITAGIDHQINKRDGSSGGIGLPLFYSDGSQRKFSRSDSISSRDNYNDIIATNYFISIEQKIGEDWSLKISPNYLHGKRDIRLTHASVSSSSAFPNRDTGDGLKISATKNKSKQDQKNIDINIQGPFTIFDRSHEATFGFSHLDYENETDYLVDNSGLNGSSVNIYTWNNSGYGDNYIGSSTDITLARQSTLYAATRFSLSDQLKLIVGASAFNYKGKYILDNYLYSYYSRTDSSETGVVTPYAGIVYDLNPNHSIYASYTSIFKPQTSADRNGTTLDPREGENYELGLKSELLDSRLNTSIAVYQIRQDNLAVVDSGYVVPGTTTSAYRAINGARTNGLDIEIAGGITPNWNITASYAYVKTEDADGERIATTMPEHMAKLWSTYRLPGDWNKLTIGGGINWQSKIYFTASPWYVSGPITGKQDKYSITNLMAKYDFNENLSTTLNINNVFDKKYLSTLDETFYSGFYGAPRNFMLTAKYSF
jgi:outer membrane receptor for ferric coprogen and ferric-rhodotorulic acid